MLQLQPDSRAAVDQCLCSHPVYHAAGEDVCLNLPRMHFRGESRGIARVRSIKVEDLAFAAKLEADKIG